MKPQYYFPFLLLIFSSLYTHGQFAHGLSGKIYPWTGEPQVETEAFRFVIIGDLTGGEEEGVFESAVEKINRMSPDFVVSVGDLIEGYTHDQATIERQWASFDNRIARLNAPFFYLPGNHDISNQVMFQHWLKKFGSDFYSFNIGNTLFLMVNNFEPGERGISEKQADYMIKALKVHDVDYPVYVFSHAPLWDSFQEGGLRDMKPILDQLNVTYFCGHEHHYLENEADGKKHYMLAKTGGGFASDNINLGEFNHFLWVTSTKQGPVLANILTSGVIPSDVVNNTTRKQVDILREGNWFKIVPTLLGDEVSNQFQTRVVLHNPGDFPLKVEGGFNQIPGLDIVPGTFSQVIEAGDTAEVMVRAGNQNNLSPDSLLKVVLGLTGTFRQDGKEIANRSEKTWIIDRQYRCYSKRSERKPLFANKPLSIEESWCWDGIEDGSFTVLTSHDADSIYIEITTVDDVLLADPLHPGNLQDKLIIHFALDTAFRSNNFSRIEFQANGESVIKEAGQLNTEQLNIQCSRKGNSIVANLVLPREHLKGPFFRLNVGFQDLDDPTHSDTSVIWWKPKWGSNTDYPGSGVFLIDGAHHSALFISLFGSGPISKISLPPLQREGKRSGNRCCLT